jgi:hypothetical protein
MADTSAHVYSQGICIQICLRSCVRSSYKAAMSMPPTVSITFISFDIAKDMLNAPSTLLRVVSFTTHKQATNCFITSSSQRISPVMCALDSGT